MEWEVEEINKKNIYVICVFESRLVSNPICLLIGLYIVVEICLDSNTRIYVALCAYSLVSALARFFTFHMSH